MDTPLNDRLRVGHLGAAVISALTGVIVFYGLFLIIPSLLDFASQEEGLFVLFYVLQVLVLLMPSLLSALWVARRLSFRDIQAGGRRNMGKRPSLALPLCAGGVIYFASDILMDILIPILFSPLLSIVVALITAVWLDMRRHPHQTSA